MDCCCKLCVECADHWAASVSELSVIVTNTHDRHRGNKGLINAAIRHAKDQLDLDLSPCSSWLRFVEVHYARSHSSTMGGSEDTSEVWAAHNP